MSELDLLKNAVHQEASQCVKCGLCLPHCPTYVVTQNECESPRGRIALLDGIATHQLPLTKKAQLYLDHCLTCRACEVVCPAEVKYGKLIDDGREMLVKLNNIETKPSIRRSARRAPTLGRAPLAPTLDLIIQHPFLLRFARTLLKLYQRSGLQFLARKSGLLKILKLSQTEALLPLIKTNITWQSYYPPKNQERGRVALFTGCISNLVDQETLVAAIKILTACGYGVYLPPTQGCCGALYLHAGYPDKAKTLTKLNQAAFNLPDVSTIITVASGCGAALKEYPLNVVDISEFIQQVVQPAQLSFKPLKKRVAIHTPCTLRNVLQQEGAPHHLLRLIPEIEQTNLATNSHCCGAAGVYMLQHTAMANTLLQPILSQLDTLQPDYLVTSNIGCALHLQRALLEKPYKTRVLHPITLLAQQLT